MAAASERQEEHGFFDPGADQSHNTASMASQDEIRPYDDEVGETLLSEFQNQHGRTDGSGNSSASASASMGGPPDLDSIPKACG